MLVIHVLTFGQISFMLHLSWGCRPVTWLRFTLYCRNTFHQSCPVFSYGYISIHFLPHIRCEVAVTAGQAGCYTWGPKVFPWQMRYVGQSRGFLPVHVPDKTSKGRYQEGILIRSPKPLSWQLSAQRSNGSTQHSLWMSKLFTLSLRLRRAPQPRKLL